MELLDGRVAVIAATGSGLGRPTAVGITSEGGRSSGGMREYLEVKHIQWWI